MDKVKVDGSVCFWSLSDKTDRSLLEIGLRSIGMEDLMPPVRPSPAILRDALQQACGDARTLIRPLGDRRGFAVVEEQRGTNNNGYSERFTVKTKDVANGLGLEFNGDYYKDADKVRLACAEWHGIASSDQVANVLVKAVAMLKGISLRPSGAIYWVPGTAVDTWTKLGAVIEMASSSASKIYRISHDFDDAAVRAVCDAVIHEIETDTERIEEDVLGGELGERALEGRQREAENMRSKVLIYQDLLAVGLGGLTSNLDKLEQTIATATLQASANKTRTLQLV